MEEQPGRTVPIPEEQNAPVASAQKVDPWNVSGAVDADGKVQAIDYDKLVDQFGTKRIDKALLERFERVTGAKPHIFLRRQIVFSHRDLEAILDRYEKKEPFYIYTGRGPSSTALHLGHLVPFTFTKWLADVFKVPVVIMLTDDEKYLISKDDTKIEDYEHFGRENAKDVIAVGFDLERTFIFSDYSYMGGDFYRNVTRIAKKISVNTANHVFGFDTSTNIGKVHFVAVQSATSYASSFPFLFGPYSKEVNKIPCVIPCAIDQDVYFRVNRDISGPLNMAKPSLIHARFLDALQGPGTKMSASVASSAILVQDTPKQVLKKINQHAFSGGQETLEEHRAKGGNPDVDVPYQYLSFLLEDDEELEKIYKEYKSGQMLTGEIKKRCAEEVSRFLTEFQERRKLVTDEILDQYMVPRPLMCHGVPSNTIIPQVNTEAGAAKKTPTADPNSKAQQKKQAKLEAAAAKKAAKKAEREDTAGNPAAPESATNAAT